MDGDPPSSFSIVGEGEMNMDLVLIEIDKLHLHEKTIPESLKSLIKAIESKGIVEDPIIVDKKTLVVLDGMHRVKALKQLGCKLMPVCLVDYENLRITVERWCRTVQDNNRTQELLKTITSKGYTIRVEPKEKAKKLLEERKPVVFLETRLNSYIITSHGNTDLISVYRSIGDIEHSLKSKGFRIGYETEMDAEERMKRGSADVVMIPPKLGKKEVIEGATKGDVFIHKATRHIIPARPMGVNVSLADLREGNLHTSDRKEKFVKTLRERKVRRIPPGNLWKGRRYEEALYVFE
jgi:hypothetical protein